MQKGLVEARGEDSARELAAFVTWTAWLTVAQRPEAAHSYTNNWPDHKTAGNTATAGAMMWSAASVAALLFFLALILYFHHRYSLTPVDTPNPRLSFDLAKLSLTPSQRATAKYFDRAGAFPGAEPAWRQDGARLCRRRQLLWLRPLQYLPFDVARTWHLQVAIFWIATAWLGMGIFIAPLVSGQEPKGQRRS